MQFSISRLLLATTAFAAMLGLAKVGNFGMIGAVVAAVGLAGIVLCTGKSGLIVNDPQVAGFSPRRVAWITASLSLALVPVHFYVSCEMSGRLACSDFGLLCLTIGLSVADRSGKKGSPIALAVIGFIAHGLCTH